MADFRARILAELDDKNIPSELDKIGKNHTLRLEDIRAADTAINALIRQIQSELDKHGFKINLINLQQQAQQAGVNAGKNFNQGLKRAVNNKSEVDRMKKDLANFNFDSKQIDEIVKDLESMELVVKKITTYLDNKSNLKISVQGFDKFGNVVNEIKRFDNAGKELSKTKSIAQTFAETGTATSKLDSDFKKLCETSKKLAHTRFELIGLDGEKNAAEIAELNRQLKEYGITFNKLKKSLDGNLTKEQKNILREQGQNIKFEMAQRLAKAQDKTNKLASASQIGNLDSKMAIWLSKNTAAVKDYGESIEVLQRRLRELSATGNMLESDLKDIAQEFNDITVSATLAGKTGKSFALSMQDAARRIVQYISIDRVFDHLINATVDMARNVYDIDTAMTGLMKVTDETSDRYNKFLKTSAASAKDLKRSISSMVEQSAEWAKLGYSIDEAEELAKLSSVYANVADVDNSTAVSDMVTAMKAFSIESQDAITIIDSMNQLGNQFATDAASLGEGLSRAASSMHVAGADMYQTLAMLTGGAEITQNAGEFGNFLKVASMRIRGMTGELEALGEEVDESVESISKVQTQILNLTHGKVNIFDSEGEFRNYFEVMKEIADVMDELSSTEQASMTELLFGKQRGNQGAALIQAFQSGQIEKAYQSALKSSGSAMAEQEKWSESLQAHLGELKATWQEVSQTFLDSEFLKNAVDVATTLLERLVDIGEFLDGDGFFGSFGLFPTVITGITTAIASFKNVGRDKMFSLRTCRLL